MPGSLRPRLLPGAPRWWLGLVVLTVLGGLATVTGRTGSAGHTAAGGPVQVLLVLLVLAPHVGLLAVLPWRARSVGTERNVSLRLAIGVAIMAGTVVVGSALELLPATRAFGATAALWASVLAFPWIYGGLLRWNRFRINLADPDDLLNGFSAVLAVIAVGTWSWSSPPAA